MIQAIFKWFYIPSLGYYMGYCVVDLNLWNLCVLFDDYPQRWIEKIWFDFLHSWKIQYWLSAGRGAAITAMMTKVCLIEAWPLYASSFADVSFAHFSKTPPLCPTDSNNSFFDANIFWNAGTFICQRLLPVSIALKIAFLPARVHYSGST